MPKFSEVPTIKSESSSLEKCSFVCHLLTIPLGLAYVTWVLLEEERMESWSITYYPPKSWSIYIPVSALCIFLAAPILYASLNSSTVPRLDSMDILNDEHTRQSSSNRHAIPARSLPPESTLPEICDLDPASLTWYSRT